MPAAPTRLTRVRQLASRHGPLLAVLAIVAALAIALHRDGLGWGDDYTLYLRQAKSLVDGNVGQGARPGAVEARRGRLPVRVPGLLPRGGAAPHR